MALGVPVAGVLFIDDLDRADEATLDMLAYLIVRLDNRRLMASPSVCAPVSVTATAEAALHNNMADLLHTAGREDEAMHHLKKAAALFADVGGHDERQPEIWQLVVW